MSERTEVIIENTSGTPIYYNCGEGLTFQASIIDAVKFGANLSKANFCGKSFAGMEIDGMFAHSAYFREADFSGATVKNSVFTNARFSFAKFSGARFYNCDFRFCKGLPPVECIDLLTCKLDHTPKEALARGIRAK